MFHTSSDDITILVIEPDTATRMQMVGMLSIRFRVVEAPTLNEAARQIVVHHPTIVLIEPDLPGDALEFIRQLRHAADTMHLCIAIVTRRASVRDKVAGFQAGADDYIVKPVQASTFLTRIALLMRVHQLNR